MEYVGQVPAPPLDRFIDDIYCLTEVPRHRRMNVPPHAVGTLVRQSGRTQSLRSGIAGRFCTRNCPRATILPSSSRSISISQICCVRPV
jgi:hypothetical protein